MEEDIVSNIADRFMSKVITIETIIMFTALFPSLVLLREKDFPATLSASLLFIIALVMGSLSFITFWIMKKPQGAGGTLLHDLEYIGFCYPTVNSQPTYFGLPLVSFSFLRISPPTIKKPANHIKSFFSYGLFRIVKKLSTVKGFINKEGRISSTQLDLDKDKGILQSFLSRTLKVSRKIMRKYESEYDIAPYAAYLFRMASIDLNPEDKEIQKKALVLWQAGLDLELIFRLRSYSLEDIIIMANLPSSWIKEIDGDYKQLR
jgi:hypothetical protein